MHPLLDPCEISPKVLHDTPLGGEKLANKDQVRAWARIIGAGGSVDQNQRDAVQRTIKGVGIEAKFVERLAGGSKESDP